MQKNKDMKHNGPQNNSAPDSSDALQSCMKETQRRLDLDLNLNTAGEFELHQSVNGLSS